MKRRFGYIISIAALLTATSAIGEVQRLQPDFTFRRIGVPDGSSGPRITVQVAPKPPGGPSTPPKAGDAVGAVVSPSTPGVAGASPQISGLEWFWLAVSPKLEDSAPGRLQQAMDELKNPPDGSSVTEPRLAALQQIAEAHGRDILAATVGTKVSPALVLAVIAVESAGDSDAHSRAGAQGLIQLMPDTATRFGISNSLDATQNIKGGVAYLDWLMREFDQDPILVLAGYNAGEGSIRDNAGVPPYAETRAYVPKVIAAWSVARALCMTPPDLMTDGCVFSAMKG